MPEVAPAPTPKAKTIAPPKEVTVLVMNTYPQPYLLLRSNGTVPETVSHKGTIATHYKPDGQHYHVEFKRHEAEVPASWMPTLRLMPNYGTDFMEILPITVQQGQAGDDAENSVVLTNIMDDPAGIGFVKGVVRNSEATVTKQFAKTEVYVRGRVKALRLERERLIKSGRNELKPFKPTE